MQSLNALEYNIKKQKAVFMSNIKFYRNSYLSRNNSYKKCFSKYLIAFYN